MRGRLDESKLPEAKIVLIDADESPERAMERIVRESELMREALEWYGCKEREKKDQKSFGSPEFFARSRDREPLE